MSIFVAMKVFAWIFCILTALSSVAQTADDYINVAVETDVDSLTSDQPLHFNAKSFILPGALMTLGIAGAIESDVTANDFIHDQFEHHHSRYSIDDYLRFAPSVAHLTLGFIPGVESKHSFRDRLLISATSHAICVGLSWSLKHCVHENRPDGLDKHSFPSGHVALAFTGAELVRVEYGNTYGIAAYAMAAGVAYCRIHNNRHWLNDVLMGAGIGIGSARLAQWLLPYEQRLFHSTKKESPTIAAIPTYNIENKAFTLTTALLF